MSRINDALKRAKKSEQENPPPAIPPLMPAGTRRRQRGDANWFLPAMIFLLVIAAFFFIALALARHTMIKTVNVPGSATTQQVESVSAPPTNPPLAPISNVAITSTPPIRLQGIFYDPAHPCAIIGGRTVYVGDMMDGMRVAAISQNAVTLIGNGRTNTLIVGK